MTLQNSLQNPFISSAIEDLTGVDSKLLSDQLLNLESLTGGDSVDQIQVLADIVYKLTECIDVKFYGVDTEEDLENHAAKLQKSNLLLAGKFFTYHFQNNNRVLHKCL